MTEVAEAPSAERAKDLKHIKHWIGGAYVAGESGRSGPVYNPATGQQSGEVDFASAEEIDRAVQTAKRTFETWRTVSLAKRAELFFNIRELVHERREEVAKILTAEHGKVLSDAGIGSHVMWSTGARKGEIVLVPDIDLVQTNGARISYDDCLDSGLVTIAVRETYDSGGAVGLLNALNDEGHLATFSQIAEEALRPRLAACAPPARAGAGPL